LEKVDMYKFIAALCLIILSCMVVWIWRGVGLLSILGAVAYNIYMKVKLG